MKKIYTILSVLIFAVFCALFASGRINFAFINLSLFMIAPVSYFYNEKFSYYMAAATLAVVPAAFIIFFKVEPLSAALPVLIFNGLQIGITKCKKSIVEKERTMTRSLREEMEKERFLVESFEKVSMDEKDMMEKEQATVGLYEITKKMSGALKFSEIFDVFSTFLKENFSFRKSDLLILESERQEFAVERAYTVWKEGYDRASKDAVNYTKLLKLFTENPAKTVYVTRGNNNSEMFENMGLESTQVNTFIGIPILNEDKLVAILTVENLSKLELEKFMILSMELYFEIKKVFLYETVEKLAITDSLTGLYVRRYFYERLSEELKRSESYNFKFAFLMIDIDDFKKCNDTYGHLVGDVILKDLGRIIKESIREIDLAARYGGEEFSVILPETDLAGAGLVAERVRKRVEANVFKAYDENLNITISIGVAEYPLDAKNVTSLVNEADKALYKAKRSGKNVVCGYNK